MGQMSYEESKKMVYKGLVLLGAVTLVEVFFSLLGKGYVIGGLEEITWLGYLVGVILIGLSLYKAYYIIYEFMHMRYEVKGLALSILLPTVLLIWAIIAFFQEGTSWKNRRQQIKDKDKQELKEDKGKEELEGMRNGQVIEFEYRG
jgi:cytochrome c oxidase subunit IV